MKAAATAARGERLHRELGYTPLALRYNPGRHISDNGRAPAGILERLVQAWPVPVEELVLVGYSIGDLVVRYPSASGAGSEGRHLGGCTHFDLLNHPDVYEQLRVWLT